MDFWLKWGGIAALCIGACVLVWGLWAKFVVEPYREEGRAEMRPIIATLEAHVTELTTALEKQSAAVREYQTAAARRLAAANAAKKRAEAQVEALRGKVEELENAKPAYPNDPCRSACKLIEEAIL